MSAQRWQPGPYENPLDGDQIEEIAPKLVELQKTQGWEIYQGLIQALVHRGREAGFDAPEDIAYWIGYVAGLTHAQRAVPEIIASAKVQIKADAARRKARSYSPADAGDPSL